MSFLQCSMKECCSFASREELPLRTARSKTSRYGHLIKQYEVPSPECNTTFWMMTIYSYTLHWSGITQIFDLFLIWTILVEFDFLPNCERFPKNICNGCGMPTEVAYSSGHLVLSHFGFANVLLLRLLTLNHTLYHQFMIWLLTEFESFPRLTPPFHVPFPGLTSYWAKEKYRGVFGEFKGPETRQVQERLVSTLEHMQVPKWDRTRIWHDWHRFPWDFCNGLGMITGNAFASGHLVLSHFGTCKCSYVETNLSWSCLASGLLSFEHPSLLLFCFPHLTWFFGLFTSNIPRHFLDFTRTAVNI